MKEQRGRSREDQIRMKNQVRKGLVDVDKHIRALFELHKKDASNKRAPLEPEEIGKRTESLRLISSEFTLINNRLSGRGAEADGAGAAAAKASLGTLSFDAMVGGDMGAAGGPREEVTAEQESQMLANRRIDAQIVR